MIYLVIPCFNEAKRLQVSYWEKVITAPNLDNTKFLFIDDGSSDGTFEVLNRLTKYSRVEAVSLGINVGKANAIRSAFQKILEASFFDCNLIGFIDSDSSFDAQEVIDILSCLENQSKLFDAFFTTGKSGGTGLGLSIALEDARLHNGELDAWGLLGQGAHFVLTLPRIAGEQIGGRPIRAQPEDYPQNI